jgi:hypothetical protein
MDTGKRDRIKPHGQGRYARRDSHGRFTSDQVDVGRSSRADQQQHAKTASKRGQGDRGDRPKR